MGFVILQRGLTIGWGLVGGDGLSNPISPLKRGGEGRAFNKGAFVGGGNLKYY